MEYGIAASKQRYQVDHMNILLLGDPSDKDDEGMRKIGINLTVSLGAIPKINAQFASLKQVCLKPKSFRRPDIIHYVVGPSWRSFVYACLIKMQVGTKVTKTVISFIHPRWSYFADMALRLFRPDAAVVQSDRWKAYCSQLGFKIWDRPIVGVDLNRFRPVSSTEKQRIRDELKLPKKKKIVLHVGHLNKGRNLIHITKLAEKDVLPIIVGSTSVHMDSALVSCLEAAGVIVIHRYIENIEKFYQAADCYVFPTIDPKFCIQIPLSILEAMACGLPVVSTRFEGLPLFFPEGYPGIKYIDDPSMLSAEMHDDLFFPERPGRERLACFDWENIAKGLKEFYVGLSQN